MRNKNKGPPAAGRGNGAGVVLGIIAIILAVSGTAVAAKGGAGLTAKQKKEVKAIAKTFAVPGPAGAQGAKGDAGGQGAQGPAGTAGTAGTAGDDGTDGTDGESITLKAATALECDERGGAIVEDEKEPPLSLEVCTGEDGAAGKDGSFGGKLPSGVTQYGSYATMFDTPEGFAALSFTAEMPANLVAGNVHFSTDVDFASFCKGLSAQLPAADPGHLCVYSSNIKNATFNGIRNLSNASSGANRTGAILRFILGAEPEPGRFSGSWAVTAP